MFQKKVLCLLSMAVGLICIMSIGASAYPMYRLHINGDEVTNKVSPQVIDNTMMVPIRSLFEYLGATVTWDADRNAVYVRDGDALTKEQKAAQLKEILIDANVIIYSFLYPEEIGPIDLKYAFNHDLMLTYYTKFNALFSEEFLTREYITPAMRDINRAFIHALITLDLEITDPYYDIGEPYSEWAERTPTNFAIILEKFDYYISIDGKYY